jgi:hypothetical protein
MMRIALSTLLVLACVTGCGKKKAGDADKAGTKPAAGSTFLTVGAYCDAFCAKLCGTCGQGDCTTSCTNRCHFGRSPDMVLDGKDPKTGLALTQKELDGCLATITSESCISIASGNVPPACYTIQH